MTGHDAPSLVPGVLDSGFAPSCQAESNRTTPQGVTNVGRDAPSLVRAVLPRWGTASAWTARDRRLMIVI